MDSDSIYLRRLLRGYWRTVSTPQMLVFIIVNIIIKIDVFTVTYSHLKGYIS